LRKRGEVYTKKGEKRKNKLKQRISHEARNLERRAKEMIKEYRKKGW